MAVLSTGDYTGPFTPDGVTTTFPFDFAALSADEVAVLRMAADGTWDFLTGYNVTLTDGSGGTVIFSLAPSAGDPLYIVSDPSFEQQATFANQSDFSAKALGKALDRAAVRDIALRAVVSRAPLAPPTESLGVLPSATVRAGKFFAFDADGMASVAGGTGADVGLRADLAASGGSALSSFTRSGAGTVARSVQAKLREGPFSTGDYSVLPTPTTPDDWYWDYTDPDSSGPIQLKSATPNSVAMAGGGNVQGVAFEITGNTSAATPNSGIAETQCLRLTFTVNSAAGLNLVPYLLNGTLTSSHNVGAGNAVESGAILVTNRIEGPAAGGSNWAIGAWGGDLHVEKAAGVAPGKMVGLEVGVHSDVAQTYGDAMQRQNGIELWSGPRDVAVTGVRAHDAISIFGASGWTNFLKILDTDGSTLCKLDQSGNFAVSKGSIGYGTGAGGTVPQATSKSTAVALNKICGAITMNAAALAANTVVTFAFNNTTIAPDDEVRVWLKGGHATAGTYRLACEGNASGARTIVVENKSAGSLSEALVLGFTVIKAVVT